MKQITFLLILASVFALALTLSACQSQSGSPESMRDNVFRLNLGTEPPDLDPPKMTDLTSFTVIQSVMRGLTQFDDDLHAVPAIAERWTRSEDGMHYVFYLRPDAQWSDGKPVTAQHFADAWQRALDPDVASEYGFFLFDIKNAKAYLEGQVKDFSQVGVHVINAHTLAVDLIRPTPFFLDLMAAPVALPIRKDSIAQHGDRFTEAGHFITNGPYQLKQWVHDEKIVLTPNPHYYGKKPKIDAVEMVMVNDPNTSVVMYENNALDFIETTTSIASFDVRRLRKSPDAHVTRIHRINYFGFNTQKKPFDNPKVRQAFAHALDRRYFPRLLQSGQQPMASWISPGLVGYNPTMGLQYNPKKAKQLLAEAGYPDGKGFPTVTLGYRTLYDLQKECEIAQFLWKQNLGVNVRLENMEWKVYLSQLKQDPPHMFLMGWFVDYPDADSFMSMMIADSGNNYTRWKNPRYDELVAQSVVTLDNQKRQILYNEAQTILLEKDTAMLPAYQSEKTWLVKPWVKGLKINAMNLISLDEIEIVR